MNTVVFAFTIFEEKLSMKNGNWIFWVIGIGSLIFMGAVLYENYMYATELGDQKQGIFGDMFGASNALFTGLSFTGVIIAILLQRQELKLQRNELELTREEMKLTRNEFEAQNSTLIIQRFENTFFQMISLHHQIVQSIETNSTKNVTGKDPVISIFKGRAAFVHDYSTLARSMDNKAKQYDISYSNFIRNRYYLYSHFFKNIKQILIIIDNATFSDDENTNHVKKLNYVDILKSQLSQHELTFLFYDAAFPINRTELKLLIEKYHVFSELNDLFIITELKEQFKKSAYFQI